jgi:hypothetical protein
MQGHLQAVAIIALLATGLPTWFAGRVPYGCSSIDQMRILLFGMVRTLCTMETSGMKTINEHIINKIRSRTGKRVSFQYPGGDHKTGILRDREVLSSPDSTGVPYWEVVDQIEFEDEEERWIRFGYYCLSPEGRLVWASKTALTDSTENWKELFVHAARQKPWFRRFLEEVMAELK